MGRARKIPAAKVIETRAWWAEWQAMPKPNQVRRELGVSENTFRRLLRREIYKESTPC